jgi:hypothetical protein
MNSESPAALLPSSFVILHREGDLPGGRLAECPADLRRRRPICRYVPLARWTGQPQACGSHSTAGTPSPNLSPLPVVVWHSRMRRPTCAKGGKRVLRLSGERR